VKTPSHGPIIRKHIIRKINSYTTIHPTENVRPWIADAGWERILGSLDRLVDVLVLSAAK
jgi:hypothetical protein